MAGAEGSVAGGLCSLLESKLPRSRPAAVGSTLWLVDLMLCYCLAALELALLPSKCAASHSRIDAHFAELHGLLCVRYRRR